MRIAYLINQYPKVSHSFIRREIVALEQQGWDVDRIAIRGWNLDLVDAGDLAERKRTRYVLQDGLALVFWSLVRMALTRPVQFLRAFSLTWHMGRRSDRPFRVHFAYLAEACRIVPWLRERSVQHLHAHFGTNSAEVAMLAAELGGPPWSFTVHGPEEFDRKLVIGLAEKVRRCNFVVAISSFGRANLYRLVDHHLWPKIQVVHCGLDAEFSDARSRVNPLNRRFVCVGRLCEQKGQLLLLESTRRIFSKGINLELVLAGDGDMRRVLEDFVTRHNLGGIVRITGWISGEQVQEEIASSRALVLPSFAEGLPVVIMEAMALERPVISTFVAGIPELVRDGKDGWLIPAGDVDALVETMEQCLATPDTSILAMGAAARTRVIERHSIECEAAKLSALFKASMPREVRLKLSKCYPVPKNSTSRTDSGSTA